MVNRLTLFLYPSKEWGHTSVLILLLMVCQGDNKCFCGMVIEALKSYGLHLRQWFKFSFQTASSLSYTKLLFSSGDECDISVSCCYWHITFFSSERTCFYYNWLVGHSEIFLFCHPLKHSEIMICCNDMIFHIHILSQNWGIIFIK